MEEEIIKVIEKIRPYIQKDGGDVQFISWDEQTGTVYVQMLGACVDCMSLEDTLTNGIEDILIEEVPAVKKVQMIL
ncbi:MAG: NifU family protein [Erysipelotrichaceae bacterium]